VIFWHYSELESRCRERGYTLDEVMACVIEKRGDYWAIDVEHPAYPRFAKTGHTPQTTHRPGTALKSILAKIGITAAPGCSCQRHAAEMDARGCDWCEQNIDTIVGWLREEATKRGLPFIDAAGRLLVKRAIRNARRAAAS
jgi:hypothetical protein